MNRIKSRTDLDVLKKDGQAQIEQKACRLFVCSGTGCVASGSEKVYNKLCELAKNHPDIDVVSVQKKHMKLTENAAKAAAVRLAPTIRNPSASRRAAATDSVKSDLWFA